MSCNIITSVKVGPNNTRHLQHNMCFYVKIVAYDRWADGKFSNIPGMTLMPE